MPEICNSVSSRVFYRKMGNGPVIVLLHGFPESSMIWQRIWDELSLSHTLIVPDFPGSGDSILDGAAEIGDMAECVKDIMDHEQISRAVIAGHSMGGYVGLEFASRYPRRIAGLSLVHSTSEADDEEKKSARRRAMEIIRNGGEVGFVNQLVANLFSADFKQSKPDEVKKVIQRALSVSGNALINFYEAMIQRADRTELLKSARFPVQWIVGADDNILNYKKLLALCHISDVNVISLYDNCGHMSMIEHPEKMLGDLKEFLNFSYNFPY